VLSREDVAEEVGFTAGEDDDVVPATDEEASALVGCPT
jgi:hypothetical protein